MQRISTLVWIGIMCWCWATSTQAQVGINILNPDTSAVLHLESTTRGFLPPRLTTTQRNAIVQPKAGLQIYNTTDSIMQYYNGRCWLSTWQRNCDDCAFSFRAQRNTGSIDRIVSNNDSTALYVSQLAGASQTIAVYIIPNLPTGVTATLSQYTVNGSDTLMLRVHADIFAPPGTYPIIVQAVCGNTIANQVFLLTVEPCIEIDITNPQTNYNLQANNNLPTSTPICVVARVASGVTMQNTGTAPVITTGNLHPNSRVGILNNGDLLARGGNGGVGAGVAGSTSTGAGGNGTDAINMTVPTHVINNGKIYGGGGGGGSVGLLVTIPLGSITTYTLGIGAGGGGGAQAGTGGNLGTGFGYYDAGTSATTGAQATAGRGGILNSPFAFGVSVVNVTLTPQVYGGNGGGYGQDGAAGSLLVNVMAQISVPLVGSVTVLNQDYPNPPPTGFPAGGTAGFAIRTNGNALLGLNTGNYQTTNIKGRVN